MVGKKTAATQGLVTVVSRGGDGKFVVNNKIRDFVTSLLVRNYRLRTESQDYYILLSLLHKLHTASIISPSVCGALMCSEEEPRSIHRL